MPYTGVLSKKKIFDIQVSLEHLQTILCTYLESVMDCRKGAACEKPGSKCKNIPHQHSANISPNTMEKHTQKGTVTYQSLLVFQSERFHFYYLSSNPNLSNQTFIHPLNMFPHVCVGKNWLYYQPL